MTIAALSRQQAQRLEGIKERKRDAIAEKNRARKLGEAAREAGDADAEDVAKMALDLANDEYQTASELHEEMLRLMGGSTEPSLSFAQNPEIQETLSQVASSQHDIPNKMRLGEFISAEELAAQAGHAIMAAAPLTVPGTVVPQGFPSPIITPPQAPLTLRDLFAAEAQATRVSTFMRRQGGIANAAVAAPGQIKAQANIVYEPVDVEPPVIASWVKYNRVDADDIDGFSSDLVQAVDYGIWHEVERLLMVALTTTTGIAAPDVSLDDDTADKALTAVGSLTAIGLVPNFLAMHPVDATAAFKQREAANGAYVAGSPWDKLPPIVQTSALAPGTALTGDSRIAAKLRVRQGVAVHIGTESDDLIRNVLTVLLEARIAPIVKVPAAVAKFSLATA